MIIIAAVIAALMLILFILLWFNRRKIKELLRGEEVRKSHFVHQSYSSALVLSATVSHQLSVYFTTKIKQTIDGIKCLINLYFYLRILWLDIKLDIIIRKQSCILDITFNLKIK